MLPSNKTVGPLHLMKSVMRLTTLSTMARTVLI
jgi:hypothetical protein